MTVAHARSLRLGIDPYFERPGYIEFRLGDYQHELIVCRAVRQLMREPLNPSTALLA
jgi:hypothetical protein